MKILTPVLIEDLRPGMTVLWHGAQEVTVNKSDLRRDNFMGLTFRGCASPEPLTRVQYKVPLGAGTFRLEG